MSVNTIGARPVVRRRRATRAMPPAARAAARPSNGHLAVVGPDRGFGPPVGRAAALRRAVRGWPRLRAAVLERDGRVCQIGGAGCLGRATAADHIVPVHAGGSDDPANLRAACGPCNVRRPRPALRRA